MMQPITSSADDIIDELWNLSKCDLQNAEMQKKQLWREIKNFNENFLRNPHYANNILKSDRQNFAELDINALNEKIENLNKIQEDENRFFEKQGCLQLLLRAFNKLNSEEKNLTSSNSQLNDFDKSDKSDKSGDNDKIAQLFSLCNSFNEKINTLFEQFKKLYEYITQEELSLELEDSSDKYEKLIKLKDIVSWQFTYLQIRINALTNYIKKLSNFLQAKNFSDILKTIRNIYIVRKIDSQYSSSICVNFYDDLYSDSNEKRLTLLFLVTKYDFNNRLSNEISNDYQSFKNENLTSLLIFIKNEFNENAFLKNLGLPNQINIEKNYDTKSMRLKIQKSLYLIKDPAILYMLAEYLNNYIYFNSKQIEYIKNKLNESNGCNCNLSCLEKQISYNDINLNLFQDGLCLFFHPVIQLPVSLGSLSIMIAFLINLTLGPIGLSLTIGICGFVTLISSILAIRDLIISFSKNKKGEIISDIMMYYFKESNEKRLLAENKIGEPPQNTQATETQQEESANNNQPATLQIPEASATIPLLETTVNQQEQGQG